MNRVILILALLLAPACASAQSTVQNTNRVVATCGAGVTYTAGGMNFPTINTAGQGCSNGTTTISGTVDENLKQVNGATVNVGTGAAGTGTQRVSVSTDSIIAVAPIIVNFTDKSGTITLGGTSQTLAAVNAARRRIIIENYCSATSQGIATAESLFINWTTAAGTAAGSVELSPCGSYDSSATTVSGEQINVYAATTGHKFVAKEQ